MATHIASSGVGGRTAAASSSYGRLGRLGFWTASHFRAVVLLWAAIAIGFGAFAPKAQHALAAAGWEASGSQSVAARHLIGTEFSGLSSAALQVVVRSDTGPVTEPKVQAVISRAESLLHADPRISRVVPPVAGVSISSDRRTAVIQGGAAGDTNAMVHAADALKGPLTALSGNGITVALTGSPALWSDFNAANHSAMMRSELYSWPVTMAILVLAFGSLVAAGLPLMLTIIGLLAAAGSLYLGTHVGAISIWAIPANVTRASYIWRLGGYI
ncbi:MAG TPA: MMPL family transporter [Mycobacteriales bacterium]|nr:MMPL family transporter [Mycobacteriales bacterium]